MTKVIEAKAIISGEDRLSGVIDKVNNKLRSFGKGTKISAEVDRLNKSLAQTSRQLEAVGRVNLARDRLSAAKLGLSGAQAKAGETAAKLAAARKANDMAATAALAGQHTAAQKAVSRATTAVNRQAGALQAAQRELNGFGVPIVNLAAHENALKASVEKTTRAIERETAALRAREKWHHEAASFRQQREAAMARSASATREGGIRPASASRAGERREKGAGTLLGEVGAGAGLGLGGVVGVGLGLRKAYDSSVSFERSMIEVGKATDTAGPALDAYGEKLLKLSRDTGKTKEQLASMLSSAGFAGRPKEELMQFTDYAAKATSAWQTNAEDTGQGLAELGNIYQANQRRIEEIGDAINTMADNSASKESDLLDFIRRAGASGRTANIAAEQMLAFGAAMKEVGVRNETAGTAMEVLLNVMKLGAEFSKKAGEGLKALGVDSDKMRKSFVKKPVEEMVNLLERINKVADPLKRAEIMTNLFGKEYQDDMAKLMNALPQIHKYLDLMGDKAQIAKGGVRGQFAQNLDKDVSKIDRATAAIDAMESVTRR